MQVYRWSEEEATRRLQSYCMTHRIKMEQAADRILLHGRLDD